ncbi:small GTP-binding domain protein, partial [Chlamydia psittaci 84-8471/1]
VSSSIKCSFRRGPHFPCKFK